MLPLKVFNIKWNGIKMAPPDAIYGLTEAFLKDKSPNKINLGVGAFRDSHGKPYVLNAVRKAEEIIRNAHMNKEYSTIAGDAVFVDNAIKLALGNDLFADPKLSYTAIQTISGTGALSLAGRFFSTYFPFSPVADNTVTRKEIHVPAPTWANHKPIFTGVDLAPVDYPYFDPSTSALDFEGMVDKLNKLDTGSLVLLHVCAHNPTGVDLTADQWTRLSDLFIKKQHFPLFDMAYQGFATGDFAKDAFAVRHFIKQNIPVALCQSFSKNMGLYGERVGTLSFVQLAPTYENDMDKIVNMHSVIGSQLKIITRRLFSSPPISGARIAKTILTDDNLTAMWHGEVEMMSQRIIKMRHALKDHLVSLESPRNWDHIVNQIGMFCYTGLNKKQVDMLIKDYSIYLTQDGRISIAAITPQNVEYLAKAIHAVS